MRLIKSVKIFSDREISWVFSQVFVGEVMPNSIDQMRGRLKSYVDSSEENFVKVSELQRQSEQYLVQDKELSWIDSKNVRLMRWLAYRWSNLDSKSEWLFDLWIKKQEGKVIPTFIYDDYLITNFDLWITPITQKIALLEETKKQWSDLLQMDKELAWIDPTDKKQVQWAWEYLKMHSNQNLNYSPTSTEETYSYILTVFDVWQGHPAERKEAIRKIRGAWTQKKYRQNLNGKKPSTYVLSTEAKSNLKKLAEARNINMNQMLEYIINKEFMQENLGSKR